MDRELRIDLTFGPIGSEVMSPGAIIIRTPEFHEGRWIGEILWENVPVTDAKAYGASSLQAFSAALMIAKIHLVQVLTEYRILQDGQLFCIAVDPMAY